MNIIDECIAKMNRRLKQDLKKEITIFNEKAERIFPGCKIYHINHMNFYDMAEIRTESGEYCRFFIGENRVEIFGFYANTKDTLEKYKSLTHNEFYDRGFGMTYNTFNNSELGRPWGF